MGENMQFHPNTSWQIPHEIALEFLYSTQETILIIGVIPVLLAIGFIGNVGFLLVLLRLDYMRTLTNLYLGNLAIADLSFISAMAVRYIWGFIKSPVDESVPYNSSLGCIVRYFVVYTSGFSSSAFVTLVTVERYFAICWPLKHLKVSDKTRSIKLVIVTWTVCALFAGTFTQFVAIKDSSCVKWPEDERFDSFPTQIHFCTPLLPWMSILYAYYVQAIPFWTSLVINTVMCIGIVRKLGRRMQSENSEQSSQSTNRDTVRNQVATMLIVNNVAFFLLLGPFQVHNIITIIEYHLGYYLISDYQYYTFLWLGRVATVANSAINPIIYSSTNSRYREAFARCFGCRKVPDQIQRKGTTRAFQMSGRSHSISNAP